jgi:hypothetical protein
MNDPYPLPLQFIKSVGKLCTQLCNQFPVFHGLLKVPLDLLIGQTLLFESIKVPVVDVCVLPSQPIVCHSDQLPDLGRVRFLLWRMMAFRVSAWLAHLAFSIRMFPDNHHIFQIVIERIRNFCQSLDHGFAVKGSDLGRVVYSSTALYGCQLCDEDDRSRVSAFEARYLLLIGAFGKHHHSAQQSLLVSSTACLFRKTLQRSG